VRLDYVAPLRWLRRVVFASAASLVVMDVVVSYLAGTNRLGGVTRFFDADFKTNFPSSYRILALLTSAILLWLITEASRISWPNTRLIHNDSGPGLPDAFSGDPPGTG